jgi:hypothetical protein
MASNTLLISVASIKERTGLHATVDEKLVLPIIKVCQDMHIRPACGSDLFDRLLAGIDDDNLNAHETVLIDNYITDALVWFVMQELSAEIVYQFYSKGVVRKTDNNAQGLSTDEIIAIENKHKRYAEHYKDCLIKYLMQNRTLFPEYNNQQLRIDSVKAERSGYTTSIYLGGDLEQEEIPARIIYNGKNGIFYGRNE